MVSSSVPMFTAPVASESPAAMIACDEVADVDVVARLRAVAEHLRPAAGEVLAAEDRDHAGLAVRVLARAVDVAEAQRHRRQAVQALVEARGTARRRASTCRSRPSAGRRMVLGRRDHVGLAVDRAAGRGEHEAPRAGLARGLEHVDRALDVRARVVVRAVDRDAHVDLRGEVEDDLGPGLADDLAHLRRRRGCRRGAAPRRARARRRGSTPCRWRGRRRRRPRRRGRAGRRRGWSR